MGEGRTQLDSLLAKKAAEKIMNQGVYNFGVYPSEKNGGIIKAQKGT